MRSSDPVVIATLEHVNRFRADVDGMPPLDDLPVGKRWDPNWCPVGRAIRRAVGAATSKSASRIEPTGISGGAWAYGFPGRFIAEFDHGMHPEYDLDKQPRT